MVAVESVVDFWSNILVCLEDRGISVALSTPSKTRLIAEAKVKIDRVEFTPAKSQYCPYHDKGIHLFDAHLRRKA